MAPHPVDVHVGRRLRSRRTMLGMSQEDLGEAVGVTFQQIQKYERGLNRIGCSRLYQFSRALGVAVSYFFEDFQDGNLPLPITEEPSVFEQDKLSNKEILALVRAYYDINDATIRKKILALVKAIAGTEGEEDNENNPNVASFSPKIVIS